MGKLIKLKDQDRYVRIANRTFRDLTNLEDWFLEFSRAVPEFRYIARRVRELHDQLNVYDSDALVLWQEANR